MKRKQRAELHSAKLNRSSDTWVECLKGLNFVGILQTGD